VTTITGQAIGLAPGETISGQVINLVGAEGYIHGYICVRPPCGPKPGAVTAASLSVRSDGTVVHKTSGWGIGQVGRSSGGAWQAGHAADGSVTEHGAKVDAVKAVARKYNQVMRSGPASPPARPAAPPGAVKTAPRPTAPRTITRQASPPPAPRKTANINAILAQPVGADVKKDVAPLFEGKYGDFTVKVDSAVMTSPVMNKDVNVQATIYDKDGKMAGIVERNLFANRLGTQVDNTQMELYPQYQGQGFASEFYKQTEARLKAVGVQRANIHADLDVGGYAWARKGFDWQSPAMGRQKLEGMASWYKTQPRQDPAVAKEIQSLLSHAQDRKDPQFPTPYDLSRVGYTPGATMWPGKEFMLGGSWYGAKNL
jgi:GNAT superfamily N-acetyltransferase